MQCRCFVSFLYWKKPPPQNNSYKLFSWKYYRNLISVSLCLWNITLQQFSELVFTYLLALPRQTCLTWWGCLSVKEYLRSSPHWLFFWLYTLLNTDSFFHILRHVLWSFLFLHFCSLFMLQSVVCILLIICLIVCLFPAFWSPAASSQLSSRIQFSFPTGEAPNNPILCCPQTFEPALICIAEFTSNTRVCACLPQLWVGSLLSLFLFRETVSLYYI